MPRIAIAGFAHETNTFSPTPTDFADFLLSTTTRSGLRGAEILENPDFAMPIGGFAAAAREAGDELVPICWYAAEPAGIVTANAFERIASEIVHGVATAGRLDGVYLDLHGAMVAAGHDDGEAEILRRVRAVVGPDMPLVASLDLHANVGDGMVRKPRRWWPTAPTRMSTCARPGRGPTRCCAGASIMAGVPRSPCAASTSSCRRTARAR